MQPLVVSPFSESIDVINGSTSKARYFFCLRCYDLGECNSCLLTTALGGRQCQNCSHTWREMFYMVGTLCPQCSC